MAKEVNKRINIWINGKEVENNIKSVRQAMAHLTNQLNKMEIGSKEYVATSKKLRDLKGIYKEHVQQLNEAEKSTKKLNTSAKDSAIVLGGMTAAVAGAAAALGKLVSMSHEYVEAYATLDDAMTDVVKYTGMTRQEVEELNEAFAAMDTRTPVTELNRLAGEAGKLGISSKASVLEFVEAADIINVALGEDLGEDAVKNIGKLAEMFGVSETMGLRGAMLATGSAINELGASSSASEGYLMDFTARLSGAANQAGISQANILGFASVLDQNMQAVEMSATAMQKMIMDMFAAPEAYAEVAGMSVEEFARILKEDANEAVLTFISTLSDKGGLMELAPIFNNLGLDGARASGVISVLAEKIDDVRTNQAIANAAFNEGTSVLNEYSSANNNSAAQLDKARNAAEQAKAMLGKELLPVLTELTEMGASGMKVMSEVAKWIVRNGDLLKTLAITYGSVYAAQKLVIAARKTDMALMVKNSSLVKGYQAVVLLLSLAKSKLAGNTQRAAAAQKLLKSTFASTPWGAIATAVTSIGVGLVKLVSSQNAANKSFREFNKEMMTQEAEAKRLFDQLGELEKGTDEYNAVQKKILDTYPELLQSQVDEQGNIRDLKEAYDELTKSIRSKIATSKMDEELSAATDKYLERQIANYNTLNVKMGDLLETEKGVIRNRIQELAEAGESANEIMNTINSEFNTGWASTQNAVVTGVGGIDNVERVSDELSALSRIVDGVKKFRKETEEIENRYSQFINSGGSGVSGDSSSGGSITNTDGSKSNTSSPVAEEASDWEKFMKKVTDLRNKAYSDEMSDWEKRKAQISAQYDELITMAEKYGKRGAAVARELESEKGLAIVSAGTARLTELMKEWSEDVDAEDNGVMDLFVGTREKWDERIAMVQGNLDELREYRSSLPEGDASADNIDAAIEKMVGDVAELEGMKLQDLSRLFTEYQTQVTQFIDSENQSQMSAIEREKQAIISRYNAEIDMIDQLIAAKLQSGGTESDVEGLRAQRGQLLGMRDRALANVGELQAENVFKDLAEFDWSSMSENFGDNIGKMAKMAKEFSSIAFDVWNSVSSLQRSMMERELQESEDMYESKSKALDGQLESGLISQKAYDAKMRKLEEDKEARERQLKRKQFEREKAANIAEATILGVLSAMASLQNGGGIPWGLIPMGISLATTALQVATIAAQPNPYAKGGYIRGTQIAMMGEAGDEWVASNKLLQDSRTARIIAALDEYQRGNISALTGMVLKEPNTEVVSQAKSIGDGNFAGREVVNNYYSSESAALLEEMRAMNVFLRDPKNRRAYISRRIEEEFDYFDNEIRLIANL